MKSTPDFRTLHMRWPKEILRVQKTAVNIRPQPLQTARNIKLTKLIAPKERPELLKIDSVQPQQSQLPLAINQYIRPAKQSPKAILYYKPKTQQQVRVPPETSQKKILQPLQQCCGSFCNYTKIAVTLKTMNIGHRRRIQDEKNKSKAFGNSQRIREFDRVVL